jgi:hypothetical protein
MRHRDRMYCVPFMALGSPAGPLHTHSCHLHVPIFFCLIHQVILSVLVSKGLLTPKFFIEP